MTTHPLATNLNHILQHTGHCWEAMRNQNIFITGGTGFFGCWLLESFLWANRHLNLNAKAHVLSRNPANFLKKYPQFAEISALQFHRGDIKNFDFPAENFSSVIHAATDVNIKQDNSILFYDSIVSGTKRVLEFAKEQGVREILLVSSGAVYGKQPENISHLKEDAPAQINFLSANISYTMGKLAAEHLSALYANQYGLNIKIARCFSFAGPYLPLDTHFALGSFLRDGLAKKPIRVRNSKAYRSYLHAADLTIWLWTILFNGQSMRPYHVGSEESISMLSLAEKIADLFSSTYKMQEASDFSELQDQYVPSTLRAREELGLHQWIGLDQIISSTQSWYASCFNARELVQ